MIGGEPQSRINPAKLAAEASVTREVAPVGATCGHPMKRSFGKLRYEISNPRKSVSSVKSVLSFISLTPKYLSHKGARGV
jgi:hypothetical protein